MRCASGGNVGLLETEADVYVVHTPRGFTETFDARTIETLVRLGLIHHERDDYVLAGFDGAGVGPLHHFYREVSNA